MSSDVIMPGRWCTHEPVQLCAHLDHNFVPPRLIFIGEVDLVTMSLFEGAIRESARLEPLIMIDLVAVTFMTSASSRSLSSYQEQITAILVRPHTIVARALTLCEVRKIATAPEP
jgi:hypothetical protein